MVRGAGLWASVEGHRHAVKAPHPPGSDLEPYVQSDGGIGAVEPSGSVVGTPGRDSFLEEVTSEHRPEDKWETARERAGDRSRRRENMCKGQDGKPACVFWNFLCLQE